MESNQRSDESLKTTKRDELMREHLKGLGTCVEDAPDDLLAEANAYADSVLGAGNND